MKKLTAILLAILLLIPVTWAQERAIKPVKATATKQALVIGNANYSHAGRLRNPVNDARAIGSTLEELGFEVTTVTDASQREMDQAIRRFGKDLQGSNGVGLFYYAGHGMQIEGENYLLPTDINPSNEFDVTYDAVPVGKLLGQMEVAENGMNVVILDACRNNPFARSFRSNSRGLAQVIAPTGTFISYATAPGSIAADGEGENGLFTEKLLKHMTTPGLTLERVFKQVRVDVQRESNNQQVPWDSSSLIGDFYFVTEEEEKLAAISAPVLDPEVERTEVQPIAPKEQKSASQVVQPSPKILSGSLAKEKLLATKECVACNLSSSNLVRLELHKSNLEGANLSQANLWEANLEAANLQQSNLKGANLSYANLAGANLSKVDLNQAYLSNTNLRGVDLRGANLWKANLEFTNFEGALLCSTTMPDGETSNRDCDTTDQALEEVRVVLSGSDALQQLRASKICRGCDLFGVDLAGAQLRGIDLTEADLAGINFSGADLSGATLSRSKSLLANLSFTNLIDAKLLEASMLQGNLAKSNLTNADLRKATLSRSNLSGANLSGANLGGANLSGVNFQGADLRNANLSGVNLRGADLRGAKLDGVKLDGAKFCATKMPNAKSEYEEKETISELGGKPECVAVW